MATIGTYGASKAALTLASENMRLEMAPLGVRVITLLTGGVATNFLSNVEAVDLPANSYYLSVKDIIQHKSEDVPMAVSPDAFAQEVLRVRRSTRGQVFLRCRCDVAVLTKRLFAPITRTILTRALLTFGSRLRRVWPARYGSEAPRGWQGR